MLKICLVLAACLFALTADEVRNAAANQWLEASNTRMDAVDPCPARNCTYSGVEGVSAVMDDWCGGAFDTKRNRLVVWGGGHNGYYGNELYAFDVDSMKWFRLTEPSTQITFNQDPMANGLPASRHTYGGLAYISHADRFFGLGGSIANSGSGACRTVWIFDFDALTWTNKGNCGFSTTFGSAAAYDSVTRKVYWTEGNNSSYTAWGLWSYDYDSNQWTRLDDTRPYYEYSSAYDPTRGLLFLAGLGHVYVYDIGSANYTAEDWSTTGGSSFISKDAVGLAYDPVADKIVGWQGGAVYALDPDTRTWTSYNPGGEPTPNSNGTYGRWRYVPSVNAFIVPNRVTQNVYFFKLTGGTGVNRAAAALPDVALTAEPNPFNAAIKIAGSGERIADSNIGIVIYDIKGKMIRRLSATSYQLSAGITWNPSGLSAGIYLIRARIGGKVLQKKVVLQK